MEKEEKLTLKEKFLKIYANLPLSVREEIIVTLEDKRPLTWNAVYIEVENDTPLAKKILIQLDEMEIIWPNMDASFKQQKIINLVSARLGVLPPDAKISIGSYGMFTRKELIKHVKRNDEIGQKMVTVDLEYLKSLKTGILYA